MRRHIMALLCIVAGCTQEVRIPQPKEQPITEHRIVQPVSYNLADLCDTEIGEKDITLHVYIDPVEKLRDYHTHKDLFLAYVKGFLKEAKFNCDVVYSPEPFYGFNVPNEFGIEIVSSKKQLEDRFWELETGLEKPKKNPLDLRGPAYSAARGGVVLINGDILSVDYIRELDKELRDAYELSDKQKQLIVELKFAKIIATLVCHEIGHCMGLGHPEMFYPLLTGQSNIPTIMDTNRHPNPEGDNLLGYVLCPLELKLAHSFVAGNNNWKAFYNCNKNLGTYWGEIAEANNLILMDN